MNSNCPLESRDIVILQAIANGSARKKIAADLGISEVTIWKRLKRSKDVAGFDTLAGLVHAATIKGWIQ